jgi:formate-dependent nitrite reductase membrane component NrfD
MKEMTWGLPVVIYLFLAGLGAGSFCLGMIAAKRKGQGWESCSRMAFRLSPIAIFIGLWMLIFDLRYKVRFWRTLTVLNFQSPMSIGVWLLSAFFLVSVLTAVFWLPVSTRKRIPWIGGWAVWDRPRWRHRLGLAGMPLALGISVYTGVLLSVTIVPLWRNWSLPLFFFISALSLGIEGGAILGMMSLRKGNLKAMEEPLQFLRRSYRILLPLYFFAALLFLVTLIVSSASRGEAVRFLTGWSGWIWWIGVMGIGILLPWIHVMRKGRESMRFAWVFSVCLLLGDFLLRFVLIYAGQGAI